MQVQTATRMVQGAQLTTTPTAYYTVPVRTKAVIKRVTLTNTSVGSEDASIYLVPSGSLATAPNAVLLGRVIPKGKSYVAIEAENHVLDAGDTIQAAATFDSCISLVVSGVEIVG